MYCIPIKKKKPLMALKETISHKPPSPPPKKENISEREIKFCNKKLFFTKY